jgi:hypothetical protein
MRQATVSRGLRRDRRLPSAAAMSTAGIFELATVRRFLDMMIDMAAAQRTAAGDLSGAG